MRLTIDLEQVQCDVDVTHLSASATVDDLIRQAGGAGPVADGPLWLDDRAVQPGDRLADVNVLEGSRLGRTARPLPSAWSGWTATVSGGLDAGPIMAVPRGAPLRIGRSPQADLPLTSPSASWSHLTVEAEGDGLRVRDSGSTNGTWVDGMKVDEAGTLVSETAQVVAGGTAILLRPDLGETAAARPGALHNLTSAGTSPFNRPPRPGRPPAPPAVTPPTRHQPGGQSAKFNLLSIIGPLIMAGVMVLVMGNLKYAAFAALSPLLGVGTWFEQKRRRTKEAADEAVRFDAALETFRQDLDRAAAQERSRRQDDAPDPATSLRYAAMPTTRLWRRRAEADDFLTLHAGVGAVPWTPPLAGSGGRLDDEVQEVVAAARIPAAPVEVDLNNAGVVGVVGAREDALAVARSLLLQAAIHAGPADLTIAVCCDPGRDEAWDWTVWLPQTRLLGDASGDRWLSSDRRRSEQLLRTLRDSVDQHPTPAVLLVLDSDVLTEGRDAPARDLLGHGRRPPGSGSDRQPVTRVAGIVIAQTQEALPAACTVVVAVDEDAACSVSHPQDLSSVTDVTAAGVSLETALQGARDLARFDDPELTVPGGALPSLVRLPPLLGLTDIDAAAITRLWTATSGVRAPIGVSESGPFWLDLVADGPHGLVGGTTGSGKSEFLRSMVAGLAACNPPTKLTFILIDFKGGAAFKACERMPHTIGTVSNLDEQLADRALRALEAELDFRMAVFARHGVDNLKDYLAAKPPEPMPRLLLVVDEFAMMARDFPDALSRLVAVATVGRSLGVHMVLATQRPAGVVNDDIRANTNLFVALRVQSREDSVNVIEVGDAAAIGRAQMGRAYVKLGKDDISAVQTALVTGRADDADRAAVELRPVVFGPPPPVPKPTRPRQADGPTDLDLLIDAVVAAGEEAGYGPPRPVWPEPLGERVALAGYTSPDAGLGPEPRPTVGGLTGDTVVFALSDDPDGQRQIDAGWDLGHGNALFIGIPGSGTSTALAAVALTLAAACPPDQLDLLVLDMGAGDLAPLARLPHAIGYAASGSVAREQQIRLLKHLRAEVDRRKAQPAGNRRLVVLIDGLATLRDDFQDFDGQTLLDGLYRAWTDGPDVGIWCAASTTRARAIPSAIDEVTTQKWLFRLADPYDYSAVGVQKTEIPPAVPGRCVLSQTRLQTHVATPDRPLPEAVARAAALWPAAEAKTSVVRQLPEQAPAAELGPAQLGAEPWRLPIGLAEADLEPACLELYENEHALIAGPARSGKSTVLMALAEVLRGGGDQEVAVWGVCSRRSPLAASPWLDQVAVGAEEATALLAGARHQTGSLVVLVDDAETFDDSDQSFAELIGANLPTVHVIAAGRSDDLRSMYSHWTKLARKARCGVLLQPNPDYDGELLGVTVPRRPPAAPGPGRGYICLAGAAAYVQTASPTVPPEAEPPAALDSACSSSLAAPVGARS